MVVAVPAKTSTFTTLLGCVSTDSLRALLMLGPKDFVILLTHSDDNLCVGLGDASKKELMEAWSADFDQSPDSAGVDNLHEFLGLRVDRKDDHMLISAPGIIAKLPAMVGSCPSSCSSPLSITHGCDDPVDPVKNVFVNVTAF